jgi:hypothetical protein
LCGGLAVFLSELCDDWVFKENWGIMGFLPIKLNEGLWAE